MQPKLPHYYSTCHTILASVIPTMPPMKNFLQSFLRTSRAALLAATKTTNPLPIVIGNESAG